MAPPKPKVPGVFKGLGVTLKTGIPAYLEFIKNKGSASCELMTG